MKFNLVREEKDIEVALSDTTFKTLKKVLPNPKDSYERKRASEQTHALGKMCLEKKAHMKD